MPPVEFSDRSMQRRVFDEAVSIYIHRSEARGQMWKTMPNTEAIHHMKSKLKRVMMMLETEVQYEEIEDDALDLLNYTAFFIRLNRGERVADLV